MVKSKEQFVLSLIVRKLLLIVGQSVGPPFLIPKMEPFFHPAMNQLQAGL
jgi:hypothetical protein